MFGKHKVKKQNENTIFIQEAHMGHQKHLHIILFKIIEKLIKFLQQVEFFLIMNHRKGEEFITRKISIGLTNIISGKQNKIKLGNIYAKRDWGFAGDYVEAMWKMLQNKYPKDYVIATGENHSVKDFINEATKILKLRTRWIGKGLNEKLINVDSKKAIIEIDKKYFRPTEVENLKGDCSKAKKELKWRPKTNFKNLVKMMIEADLNRN